MKRHKNRSTVLAILLVLLSTAGSDVSRAQRAGGGAKLVVSVTVPTICTIAVTPGPFSAAESIAVRCRNLPAAPPQPVVTEAMAVHDATMITGSQAEVFESPIAAVDPHDPAPATDPVGSASPVSVIVINF